MQKPNYDITIPPNIRYDPNLKDLSKLLYGEIESLSYKTGKCWASNNYFAELYNVDKRTIIRCLNELKENGYIDCVIYYKENSKIIDKREISPSDKNVTRWCQNCHEGDDENVTRGSDKNVTDNTTSINTTSININNKDEIEKELEISNYDWIHDD